MSGLIRVIPDTLSALDRGLAYGDGVFETIAVRNNLPCYWDEHFERLRQGCDRLGMPCPDARLLEQEAGTLCTASEGQDAVLKIIVTRGQGGRGYRGPEAPQPWHGLSLYHAPQYPVSYYSEGIHACICKTRLGSNPALAGIKHLNRLEQVLARNELDDGCQEGLMLDGKGRVVEGTMSNIFLISDGALITPAIQSSGVRGVARDRLIRWAKQQGIDCQEETEVRLEQVFSANALLVCNSVIGVWPVQQLEHVTYSMDDELLVNILNRFPAICD